jgi:uncharacterized glyoxalase superfamily protein PhnB
MKLQGVIPVIEVSSMERQLEFYQQAFRFIIINKRSGARGLEWVHLKSDDTYLMLQRRQAEINAPVTSNPSIVLYYFTDDVQSCYRFMRAKGIEVGPLCATEYGMTEYFLHDPEGNRLAVGQFAKQS